MTTTRLTVTTPTEREIAMTRVFEAPRRLVFEAWTSPALLQRWMLGPDGWSLAVCDLDLRVGGAYRFVWRKGRTEMAMGGVYLEVVPPARFVCTERFDDPWYEGEAVSTVVLVEEDGRTTMTNIIRYESKAVRDSVLRTPMEEGVAVSYDRLAALMAERAYGG